MTWLAGWQSDPTASPPTSRPLHTPPPTGWTSTVASKLPAVLLRMAVLLRTAVLRRRHGQAAAVPATRQTSCGTLGRRATTGKRRSRELSVVQLSTEQHNTAPHSTDSAACLAALHRR